MPQDKGKDKFELTPTTEWATGEQNDANCCRQWTWVRATRVTRRTERKAAKEQNQKSKVRARRSFEMWWTVAVQVKWVMPIWLLKVWGRKRIVYAQLCCALHQSPQLAFTNSIKVWPNLQKAWKDKSRGGEKGERERKLCKYSNYMYNLWIQV